MALQGFPRPGEDRQVKPVKEMTPSFQLSSLELLNSYGNVFKKFKMGKSCSIDPASTDDTNNKSCSPNKLSPEEIMRVAGARYVQFSDMRYDDFSMIMHPFGQALSGLSDKETKDVELVHLLLAAAEKVGYEQFERGSRLLSRCEWIASERSNPVQRIVHYFAEALRERIDRATGRFMPKETKAEKDEIYHGLGTNIVSVSSYEYLPLVQAVLFTGIQAIVDNVASSGKIHIVDLQIRSGVQWSVLMQALAERERRVEILKITAVVTPVLGKQNIEECGKRLESVAASFKLPFFFNTVYVEDMNYVEEEIFKIGRDETLAVYCPFVLRTLLSSPSCLENLMRVIKNLNPALMVVMEVEANHNSPSFVSRFIEALFFYTAYFDAIDTCLAEKEVELRKGVESIFRKGIRHIVAMEGEERIARSVKMEVWSAFFAKFRMVELEFSNSSLYQANLVIEQFPCARFCTLERIGKSVVVGWKGTPINSVSAWKFSRDRRRLSVNFRF